MTTVQKVRWTRPRKLALLLTGVLLVVFGRPCWHLFRTAWADGPADTASLPAGRIDDASHLEEADVVAVHRVVGGFDEAVTRLRGILAEARIKGTKVAIAGARHSMGGHTIAPGGIAVDMLGFRAMSLDVARQVLVVQAGARWFEVLEYLDPFGYSVCVMQSNCDFTVGGSISVNCHGWEPGRAPIASTVRSFRIMLADGTVLRCSRQKNTELFGLALGGYGLFGVILDVELEVVRNECYVLHSQLLPLDEFAASFPLAARDPRTLGMVVGRMNMVPASRFEDGLLIQFLRTPDSTAAIPALTDPPAPGLRRAGFRGSVGSDYGKRLRWRGEKAAMWWADGQVFSRNQLLFERVAVYGNRNAGRTDILHEYFVPRPRLAAFLEAVRGLLPRDGVDLLNVTVRDVRADLDTYLRYARVDMVALVMLFNMERDAAADEVMRGFTREMIDLADSHGGRFYLPYRLHATRQQVERAYPMIRGFFASKRRFDPGELFVNRFYLAYGR